MRRKPLQLQRSNTDLWWGCLLAQTNLQAFLRMGACQRDSQKDISQESLPVKVQTCRWTDMHTPYLFFAQQQVTYSSRYTQAYTFTQKTVYQFDMVLRLLWQYQLLVWLRWCRPRQDGCCHLIWVRGSWDGEGGQLSSSHAVYPSTGLCVYLTSSRWLFVSSLCLSICFKLSAILPCLSLGLLPPPPHDGWINFTLLSLWQSMHP